MADVDTWDADGFEPEEAVPKMVASDRWEGEDEERTVKDNWDDEEQQQEQEAKQSEVKVPEKRKKKLNDKIKQKEQKAAEERKVSRLDKPVLYYTM
ncbi:eukaryotic translation initiation factor 3 subunit J-A-like isoform X2 [Heptranchias perlo]|uniref:eukaryotic translation initiation factor 3 subunit J-A-like isoform X2 n=1 Tax=Heptranchias perlo TaxID=212740 RepID=UPI0035593E17